MHIELKSYKFKLLKKYTICIFPLCLLDMNSNYDLSLSKFCLVLYVRDGVKEHDMHIESKSY